MKRYNKFNSTEKLQLFEEIRFNGKVECPYCNSKKYSGGITKAKDYHCNGCNRNYTLYTKTNLHRSELSLDQLFELCKLFSNASYGVSVRELGRNLNLDKKSVHRIINIIRENLPDEKGIIFSGEIQADEAYIGGKNSNRHWNKKIKDSQGRSGKGQLLIIGIQEYKSKKVIVRYVESADIKTLNKFIDEHVEKGSTLYTDEWKGYNKVADLDMKHERVTHKKNEYKKGKATTNGIENYWSHLKRSIKGTYIKMSKNNIHLFLRESLWRFNTKNYDERFEIILEILLSIKEIEDIIEKKVA